MIRKIYIKLRAFYFLYIKGYAGSDKNNYKPLWSDYMAVVDTIPAMIKSINNKRILRGLNNIDNKLKERKIWKKENKNYKK